METFEDIRKYTWRWLEVIFGEDKEYRGNPNIFAKDKKPKSFGHGFFSGLSGNKFKNSVPVDGLYYALCLVAEYWNDGIHNLNTWNAGYFDFVNPEKPFKNPWRGGGNTNLCWNLYNALKYCKQEIEK